MITPGTGPGPRAWLGGRGRGWRVVVLFGVIGFIALCAIAMSILLGWNIGVEATVIGLAAAILPVPVLVACFLWLDRYEPEPAVLLAFAFAWGAFVATLAAYGVNTGAAYLFANLGLPESLVAVLVAPFIEETMKALGPALILVLFRRGVLRHHRRHRLLRALRGRLRDGGEHPLPRRPRLRGGRRAVRPGVRRADVDPDLHRADLPDRLRPPAVHLDDRHRAGHRGPLRRPLGADLCPAGRPAGRDDAARHVEPGPHAGPGHRRGADPALRLHRGDGAGVLRRGRPRHLAARLRGPAHRAGAAGLRAGRLAHPARGGLARHAWPAATRPGSGPAGSPGPDGLKAMREFQFAATRLALLRDGLARGLDSRPAERARAAEDEQRLLVEIPALRQVFVGRDPQVPPARLGRRRLPGDVPGRGTAAAGRTRGPGGADPGGAGPAGALLGAADALAGPTYGPTYR